LQGQLLRFGQVRITNNGKQCQTLAKFPLVGAMIGPFDVDLHCPWIYRGDLHVLVEAPDGTMAASTIMWLDEVNKTAEFEPVGTHPGYRRRGLGRAMLLHGMHLARAAGATHMTVACLGAPGHPRARGLYY